MAKVQVLNVAVLDNPSPFGNPFQFEITFECMEDLPEGGYFSRAAVTVVGVSLGQGSGPGRLDKEHKTEQSFSTQKVYG